MFAGIYASLKPGGSCACIQWNSSTWSQAAFWRFSIPRALFEFVVWEGDRVPLQSFKYCTKPMSRADSHPSDDARPFFSWRPCGSPSSRCFCSLPAAWRSRFHWNWCFLEAKRLVCDWRKAALFVIHYIGSAEKKMRPVPMCIRKSGMAREWPHMPWAAATEKKVECRRLVSWRLVAWRTPGESLGLSNLVQSSQSTKRLAACAKNLTYPMVVLTPNITMIHNDSIISRCSQ